MNRNAELPFGAVKAALKPSALQTLARGSKGPGFKAPRLGSGNLSLTLSPGQKFHGRQKAAICARESLTTEFWVTFTELRRQAIMANRELCLRGVPPAVCRKPARLVIFLPAVTLTA